VALPPFTAAGDLPPGVHRATLAEALARFGGPATRRRLVARRLERIYTLVRATGHVARFIVFGSFVTSKPEPNDIDVFLLMDDDFDVTRVTGEARLLFEHAVAHAHFGASVFWLRRLAALDGEEAVIAHWQITRGGYRRGVVEIVEEQP